MRINTIIKNQKGFSLTEIMIAVGLMGGVSLVSMKLMDNQAGNERVLKSSAEVGKAVAMLQAAIANDASCKSLLQNTVPTTGAGTAISPLRKLTRTGEYMEILSDNKNYGAFFLKPGDIRFVHVSDNPAGTVTANLVITFRTRKAGAKGNFTSDTGSAIDNTTVRTIPVEYKPVSATNRAVVSCGPVLSEANEMARKKFCASLDPSETEAQNNIAGVGFAYWNGSRCILNSKDCPWGEVPKEMTNLGNVQCVPLETTIDAAALQQMFDTTTCRQSAGGGMKPFTVTLGGDGRLKIQCQ